MAEQEIVLATGNAGKLRELSTLLAGTGVTVRAQSDWGVESVEETGLSFLENALLKARHAARHTGLPAIADDSGIICDALGAAPGIYSARYAGVGASDQENLERLLRDMAEVPEGRRGCRYICVMVYLAHPTDASPFIAQGVWQGTVARAPRGAGGFGYDPIFVVPGGAHTAAELDPSCKNQLSHRGQALRALVAQFKT